MSFTNTHRWTLEAPPERVFAALTEPTQLKQWFAEEVEVGRAVGDPFRFWGKHTLGNPGEKEARGTITRYDPARALAFTWPMSFTETTVRLELAPHEKGTRVKLEHEVAGGLGVSREKELIDDHWRMVAGNLMAHLAGKGGVVLPDFADETPEVRLTIHVDAPPAAVFRALIEPERVARWVGTTEAVVEPRVGGAYRFNFRYKVDGRDVVGGPTRILELVPNERLVVDWPDWRGDETVTGQTITWTLAPEGDGTLVTLVHAGFGRTADIGDYPFGWQYFADALKKEVEDRRA